MSLPTIAHQAADEPRDRPAADDDVQGEIPLDPHYESLGRQLAMTAKAAREWYDARLAEQGGSLPMWIVLWQTAESTEPGGPSQRELARCANIGGPTLVRHLDRFEAEGLVVRQRDPHDRRIIRITLTDEGRARHRTLAKVQAQTDAQLRALVDPDELATFRSVLDRISRFVADDDGCDAQRLDPMPGMGMHDHDLDDTALPYDLAPTAGPTGPEMDGP